MKKLVYIIIAGFIPAFFFSCTEKGSDNEREDVFLDQRLITEAENLIGLNFDTAEIRQMEGTLTRNLRSYEDIGKIVARYLKDPQSVLKKINEDKK